MLKTSSLLDENGTQPYSDPQDDMNERTYLRMKKQIEDEAKEKLRALELVWQMAQRSRPASQTKTAAQSISKGTLLKAIREALPTAHGTFTVKSIRGEIESRRPELASMLKRASLSSALKRLEDAGEIKALERGTGKRPTRYLVAGARQSEPTKQPEPEDIPF